MPNIINADSINNVVNVLDTMLKQLGNNPQKISFFKKMSQRWAKGPTDVGLLNQLYDDLKIRKKDIAKKSTDEKKQIYYTMLFDIATHYEAITKTNKSLGKDIHKALATQLQEEIKTVKISNIIGRPLSDQEARELLSGENENWFFEMLLKRYTAQAARLQEAMADTPGDLTEQLPMDTIRKIIHSKLSALKPAKNDSQAFLPLKHPR